MKDKFKNHVNILKKDGRAILESLTPEKCDLLHMTIGINGESGELLDAIKKHVVYEQELDIDNVIEEIGDILFYTQGVINILGLDLEEIIEHNIKKLSKRYPKGYSNDSAKARAGKD